MSIQSVGGKYEKPTKDKDTDDLRLKIAHQGSTNKLRRHISELQDENKALRDRVETLEG
jgi:hypothetical protein